MSRPLTPRSDAGSDTNEAQTEVHKKVRFAPETTGNTISSLMDDLSEENDPSGDEDISATAPISSSSSSSAAITVQHNKPKEVIFGMEDVLLLIGLMLVKNNPEAYSVLGDLLKNFETLNSCNSTLLDAVEAMDAGERKANMKPLAKLYSDGVQLMRSTDYKYADKPQQFLDLLALELKRVQGNTKGFLSKGSRYAATVAKLTNITLDYSGFTNADGLAVIAGLKSIGLSKELLVVSGSRNPGSLAQIDVAKFGLKPLVVSNLPSDDYSVAQRMGFMTSAIILADMEMGAEDSRNVTKDLFDKIFKHDALSAAQKQAYYQSVAAAIPALPKSTGSVEGLADDLESAKRVVKEGANFVPAPVAETVAAPEPTVKVEPVLDEDSSLDENNELLLAEAQSIKPLNESDNADSSRIDNSAALLYESFSNSENASHDELDAPVKSEWFGARFIKALRSSRGNTVQSPQDSGSDSDSESDLDDIINELPQAATDSPIATALPTGTDPVSTEVIEREEVLATKATVKPATVVVPMQTSEEPFGSKFKKFFGFNGGSSSSSNSAPTKKPVEEQTISSSTSDMLRTISADAESTIKRVRSLTAMDELDLEDGDTLVSAFSKKTSFEQGESQRRGSFSDYGVGTAATRPVFAGLHRTAHSSTNPAQVQPLVVDPLGIDAANASGQSSNSMK